MHRPRATLSLALAALACAGSLAGATAARPAASPAFRVLVFTRTAGFRHESIPAAIRSVEQLGLRNGFAVEATEDASVFSDSMLRRFDVVAFVLTTGDVLDQPQEAAFRRWVRGGGGFVGVHSAADTEHAWPWYGRLVGAYFKSHPAVQRAAIDVTDRRHPSTVDLPRRWIRTDEWYNFAAVPRPSVRVLARLDEASYGPGDGAMGDDHPIVWSHFFEGGRAWYTGGGHTSESYSEPLFLAHLLGGIRFAAAPAPPTIRSVVASVRSRRLVVTVRFSNCLRCAGEAAVRVGRRERSVPLRAEGAVARAVGPVLPPGRWTLRVSLEDRATGRRTTVRRSILVR